MPAAAGRAQTAHPIYIFLSDVHAIYKCPRLMPMPAAAGADSPERGDLPHANPVANWTHTQSSKKYKNRIQKICSTAFPFPFFRIRFSRRAGIQLSVFRKSAVRSRRREVCTVPFFPSIQNVKWNEYLQDSFSVSTLRHSTKIEIVRQRLTTRQRRA